MMKPFKTLHPFKLGVIMKAIASWSPTRLFSDPLTKGAWYDPSDMTTLFRDAAGTLPVTAVEQPVGLMLDKSKGLVLGPELVTNGADFVDSNSDGIPDGWNAGGSATISVVNEKLRVLQTTTTGAFAYQAIQCTFGRRYKCSFSFESVNGSTLAISVSTVVGNTDVYVATPGLVTNYTFTFVATATTTHYIQLQPWTSATNREAYFDNISVRELPGNHAFNPSGNSANFPVLSARYNLLTKTEDFLSAAWATSNATLVSGKIVADATPGVHQIYHTDGVGTPVISGIQYTESVEMKAGGYTQGFINFWQASDRYAYFDLETGSVISAAAGLIASILPAANGYFRCTVTATTSSATGLSIRFGPASGGTYAFAGNGVDGIYARKADLRVANDALNQPAYQRVNTTTDYDTVGFKPYLSFNGVNQWLQTNSIDFTYGDKMFVSAGVRRLRNSAVEIITELSTDFNSQSGTFVLSLEPGPSVNFGIESSGLYSIAYSSDDATPSTGVITTFADKGLASGEIVYIRKNGSTRALTRPYDQNTTGTFGTYPLYIGARAGSSLWFNGRLYSLIVAGKQASAVEITSTETYLNTKTGAF